MPKSEVFYPEGEDAAIVISIPREQTYGPDALYVTHEYAKCWLGPAGRWVVALYTEQVLRFAIE